MGAILAEERRLTECGPEWVGENPGHVKRAQPHGIMMEMTQVLDRIEKAQQKLSRTGKRKSRSTGSHPTTL